MTPYWKVRRPLDFAQSVRAAITNVNGSISKSKATSGTWTCTGVSPVFIGIAATAALARGQIDLAAGDLFLAYDAHFEVERRPWEGDTRARPGIFGPRLTSRAPCFLTSRIGRIT
jgi:hypothetical protein